MLRKDVHEVCIPERVPAVLGGATDPCWTPSAPRPETVALHRSGHEHLEVWLTKCHVCLLSYIFLSPSSFVCAFLLRRALLVLPPIALPCWCGHLEVGNQHRSSCTISGVLGSVWRREGSVTATPVGMSQRRCFGFQPTVSNWFVAWNVVPVSCLA